MKKSNKILLGGILLGVLALSAIHVTLYAKYKNGNYTIFHREHGLRPQSMQAFPGVTTVEIHHVWMATVRFGDLAEVEKSNETNVRYHQQGNTLVITGPDSARKKRRPSYVTIFVPRGAKLVVYNSTVGFQPSEKEEVINADINLHHSQALFLAEAQVLQFGHVKILAKDSSNASFQGNTIVGHLDVQLWNSGIEYGKGDFGQLSIVADSVSRISLQTKHLSKAKITTLPNE